MYQPSKFEIYISVNKIFVCSSGATNKYNYLNNGRYFLEQLNTKNPALLSKVVGIFLILAFMIVRNGKQCISLFTDI